MRTTICKSTVHSILLACLLFSCAKRITTGKLPFKEIVPNVDHHEFVVSSGKEPIRVLYLGCGNLAIEYKNEAIVVDPFFSTHGFTSKKIKSDTSAFLKYQKIHARHNFNLSSVNSVWIAHTHYDHMMDIPMLLTNDYLKDATIYGNDFGDDILVNFLREGQYHSLVQKEVFDPENPIDSISFIPATSSIRILPILSNHAPHYKIGPIKFHLMRGDIDKEYFKTNLIDAVSVTSRNQWKEGSTYSFLVDFMNGDEISYRVFIQTSGSNFPKGKPPIPLPGGKKIDVAFLCTASANYVTPYPVDILNTLAPSKVVFIHWEDFFLKPLDFETTKLVRFTNFRKIKRRLRRNRIEVNKDNLLMPRPGTLITIQ